MKPLLVIIFFTLCYVNSWADFICPAPSRVYYNYHTDHWALHNNQQWKLAPYPFDPKDANEIPIYSSAQWNSGWVGAKFVDRASCNYVLKGTDHGFVEFIHDTITPNPYLAGYANWHARAKNENRWITCSGAREDCVFPQ